MFLSSIHRYHIFSDQHIVVVPVVAGTNSSVQVLRLGYWDVPLAHSATSLTITRTAGVRFPESVSCELLHWRRGEQLVCVGQLDLQERSQNPARGWRVATQRGKPAAERQLSRDDIGHQARVLLNQFIHDRMERDGVDQTQVPAAEDLQDPGTPTGPPMDHIREIGRALRCIGDELDRNENIQQLCDKVSPDAPHQTFLNVAKSFFSDGVYNWGRVGCLFYFAYKMAVKALSKINLIRAIINWIVNFITDYVAPWIIERGGWEAIVEYFGTPTNQARFVLGLGILASVGIYLWKTLK
ncbi:hypothetical protein FSP39_009153 [Pinctada imbricata]|uniref:Bcl-2 Bcl-2 homology region 1-3 domain-containing protein n=1 Tax=Pinctada imbricata TaxID=66713 RepID=A0AA88YN86_PINIB|nr:hypothetical protein FSP39_009153 [Pinctada imbricata]